MNVYPLNTELKQKELNNRNENTSDIEKGHNSQDDKENNYENIDYSSKTLYDRFKCNIEINELKANKVNLNEVVTFLKNLYFEERIISDLFEPGKIFSRKFKTSQKQNSILDVFFGKSYDSLLPGIFVVSGEEFDVEFFRIFNPEVLYVLYKFPYICEIELFYILRSSKDIYDGYGYQNINMILQITKTKEEIKVGLYRDHYFDKYEIDEEKIDTEILDQIIDIIENKDSSYSWEDFIVKCDENLSFNDFRKKFYSHFREKDLWV